MPYKAAFFLCVFALLFGILGGVGNEFGKGFYQGVTAQKTEHCLTDADIQKYFQEHPGE